MILPGGKMNNQIHRCVNCSRSEQEVPLLALQYDGQSGWICSQCLQILIHNPHKLANRLQGVGNLADIPVVEE
jgi:hypothetical protein